MPCIAGVPGWKKVVTQRKSGKTKGKFDVCVISPEGRKFRSRVELQRYLSSSSNEGTGSLSIENFDFKVPSSFADPHESSAHISIELRESGQISKEEESHQEDENKDKFTKLTSKTQDQTSPYFSKTKGLKRPRSESLSTDLLRDTYKPGRERSRWRKGTGEEIKRGKPIKIKMAGRQTQGTFKHPELSTKRKWLRPGLGTHRAMLGHLWLSLLVGAAAQVEVNEVGLSLAKASAASSVQAHVDIAKMTGDLMAKQKQLSTAKLKVEQLITEERAFAKRTDLLEQQESRMEEMLKLHGSVSEKASQAKAKAQAFQKQMLSQEAEVKALQEAIKSQSSLLKSSEEKLQLLKQKEDDYSHGARLAVLKSNKLERDLKDARIELEKKKANFTEQHEVAEIAAAKRDSVHRIQEHQKEENEESSQWIAAHRGEATVINEQTISMAENDVENAKELLKQSRQKTKEQAEANAKAVAQQRQKFLEWEMAFAEAMKQAQAQLQSAREDQEKALAAASRRIQSSLTDVNAAERTMRAKSELKSVNAKLAEEEKKLKQQHLENKAKAQEISKETAQMDATKKKHESTMKSEMEKEEQKMKKMKMDAQEMWKKDRAAEANMETTLHKVRSDKEHEKRQVEEVDAELRRARKRLQKAQVKLQIAEQQGKQQQLDYEQKMYQANVKAEEHAQEEVEKLQIEFHQLHEDKNAKITELSHKLEETRAGKLRGS